MRLTQKTKMVLAIIAICFVVYNTVLFVLCGFTGHGAGFWISFIFMTVAFLLPTIGGMLIGARGLSLRDWLFGFPLVKHSAVYLACEFTVSTLFIVLDYLLQINWGWVLVPQLIILGVYLIFAISCLFVKQTIDEIHTKTKDKTSFIRLLKVDADMLIELSSDPEAKKTFSAFADEVRYSDPMSSEVLFELEKDISLAVTQARNKLSDGDESAALELCHKASLLLAERNKKTQALK